MKRKIMKKILVLFALLLTGLIGKSQDYDLGIGLRGGVMASGLSAKYFFQPEKAIEGVLTSKIGDTRYDGFMLTGLLEIQKPFHARTLSLTSLSWYYGVGAHAGSFSTVGVNHSFVTAGVNALFGLEYLFIDLPISISADLMPIWSFNSDFYLDNKLDLSLSIRYVIK